MATEHFFHPESATLLKTLEEAADRSGLSRGRVFEDFLQMVVSSLSGGRMEDQYLDAVKRHARGEKGRRGCDLLARMFGELVEAMEQTRSDVLGDLFQGAITHGENGQFLTPENVCELMARMTVEDSNEAGTHECRKLFDSCCGSGRLLLAAAKLQPHWDFCGQDIDLRCVRMTTINLALRNLYGYVIWGNTLANERRLVYRTGFDQTGFISEVLLSDCPEPLQRIAVQSSESPLETMAAPMPRDESSRAEVDGCEADMPRRTNQLHLF
jgi:type I restriction-modification system DNA methylase subunit